MAREVVVTCDWKIRTKPCGDPAPIRVDLPVDGLNFHGDLCPDHEEALRLALAKLGLQATTRVNSKVRAAYEAKSGTPFGGQDARPWLIERGLAGEHGRLSAEAIAAYAAEH